MTKKEGLEKTNARMKGFIGFQRVVDISTLGMNDREIRWTGRKSVLVLTRTAYDTEPTDLQSLQ